MVDFIRSAVHFLIQLLTWFIIIGSLFTFIPPSNRNKFICKTIHLLNVILSPIRKFVPPLGGIDLSPLVAIIILQLIDQLVRGK